MTRYLALLRGVNVGGKSLVKMADLKVAVTQAGFTDVKTYINSGNVLFSAPATDTRQLAEHIQAAIEKALQLNIEVVVVSHAEWQRIIDEAPQWWGQDDAWKHNLLVLIPPYTIQEVVAAIGVLKPDIETMEPGDGVLYQSMSKALFGRTTTGKLAASPIYKRMTVRNYNTATKLLSLFD